MMRHCFYWMIACLLRCTEIAGRGVAAGLPAFLLLAASGCGSSRGPDVLVITGDEYERAFAAADELARREGLAPTLRDPRTGVIETSPRAAGTLLEPWRDDNASLEQAWSNTVSHQRRRARFEFTPRRFEAGDDPSADDVLPGPDVLGMADPPLDLTTFDGEIELRVWVYLERETRPGLRRNTWSRGLTSRATTYDSGENPAVQRPAWVPVMRDAAYERRLLARLAAMLGLDATEDET